VWIEQIKLVCIGKTMQITCVGRTDDMYMGVDEIIPV
jgi:hypothetical protein